MDNDDLDDVRHAVHRDAEEQIARQALSVVEHGDTMLEPDDPPSGDEDDPPIGERGQERFRCFG